MEGETTISKETMDLAYAVHEAGFVHLQHVLSAQHVELVREWAALEHHAQIADCSLRSSAYERSEAPSALLQSLAIVLRLLPAEQWPEEVCSCMDSCPLALEALRALLPARADAEPEAQEAPM